ncbi:GNAT family N-acetyltransferase [Jannaschia sp. W003]|uniref:GNAT family N-acetyltransferase n=1 Tax=Jannaschia sp. W003 TaxID=2867012 RepID=UPI0021A6340F|nr:GNAT family N-acetyltransferase [Jannaschia sp. W003]UWQ20955.1 GNAT family N-acetyltransferase [Jannaschia sp. W003]
MDITLKAVEPADREAWAALWRDYLVFYGTARDRTAYDAAFAQLLSDDPHSFAGRLALSRGRVIGLAHWVWHPHMWNPGGVIYLQDLYVAPRERGRGVASRLIAAAYEDADRRGAASVYWLTQCGNPARALYDRVAERTEFVKYQRSA